MGSDRTTGDGGRGAEGTPERRRESCACLTYQGFFASSTQPFMFFFQFTSCQFFTQLFCCSTSSSICSFPSHSLPRKEGGGGVGWGLSANGKKSFLRNRTFSHQQHGKFTDQKPFGRTSRSSPAVADAASGLVYQIFDTIKNRADHLRSHFMICLSRQIDP